MFLDLPVLDIGRVTLWYARGDYAPIHAGTWRIRLGVRPKSVSVENANHGYE